MMTRAFALAAAAALSLSIATEAAARAAPPEMTGSAHEFFKKRKRVAVPAYHVTYITQTQGTAVKSIGARARLNLMLEGVDQATMRRLTDEAHADLVGRLKAAGFDVLSPAEAKALAAGLPSAPGNVEVVEVGAGITLNKSIKFGWTAMGATDAPLIKAFHDPASPTGALGLQAFSATGKLGGEARKADAVALVPNLIVDFASMGAGTGSDFLGRDKASVDADVRFGLKATSGVAVASAYDKGAPFMGGWRLKEDFTLPGAFAAVDQGGAAVRAGPGLSAQADQNHVVRDRARGDAVIVDLPKWEALVREAYQAYNAAIVAAALKARG